jgi:hypothetical protein
MKKMQSQMQLRTLAASILAGITMTGAGYISMRTAFAADAPAADRPAPPDGPRPDRANRGPDNDQPGKNRPAPDDRQREGPPPGQGERGQNDNGPRGNRPQGGPLPLQRAIDDLGLTPDQKQKIDPILEDFRKKQQQARADLLKQMKETLTPEQYQKIESIMMRPPGPPRREDGEGPDRGGPDNGPQNRRPSREPSAEAAPTSDHTTAKADPSLGVSVTLTGGFDTDPRDHGRPVILVASALNVTPEVFREAFSHVTPASGGREPEEAQVKLNKQALMQRLSPLGVTDDRLNEVSNMYRYSASRGQMWRHTPAVVYATVKNGVVTGFTIADAGAGYSSPPKISIAGMENVNATAALSFATDFAKNGSIKEISIRP